MRVRRGLPGGLDEGAVKGEIAVAHLPPVSRRDRRRHAVGLGHEPGAQRRALGLHRDASERRSLDGFAGEIDVGQVHLGELHHEDAAVGGG